MTFPPSTPSDPTASDVTASAGPRGLADRLAAWAGADALRGAVADLLMAMAEGGRVVAGRLAEGALHGDPAGLVGTNSDGDAQKALDLYAHDVFVGTCLAAGAAVVGSEEAEAAIAGDPAGRAAIAFDPIDGSSHLGLAAACGTLFSVMPAGADPFRRPGRDQLAAGYLVYGPEVVFGFTVGEDVELFTLDAASSEFRANPPLPPLPAATAEIGVDLSFLRHWRRRERDYVAECLAGADGPRGADVRLRWSMAAVIDLHRILLRGGIFILPADERPGNRHGRLRHVYEVAPMALLIEAAGGRADDGEGHAILDRVPESLHARAPLVAGSRAEVERYLSFPGE